MKNLRKKERWVVKAGSQLIFMGGPLLIRDWMRQVAHLAERGVEIVWVTSGAIATAIDRTHLKKRERSVVEKQSLSAIGQPLIMSLYSDALQGNGKLGAQILLCYDDILNQKRRLNFKNTTERLLEWGVTPVLNENDVVSTEEIQFGDNDSLSAKVARVVGADRLVIMTDVEGVYDKDPAENPSAMLLKQVDGVPASVLRGVSKAAGSKHGTGGMLSKLGAAQEALKSGIETFIVKGDLPQVLERLARGEAIGTHFRVKEKKRGRK